MKDKLSKAASAAASANTYGTHDGQPTKIMYIQDVLPKHESGKTYSKRDVKNINRVIIHHSGVLIKHNWTIEAIALEHIDPDGRFGKHGGAPAICYHYAITGDGEIFKVNDLDLRVWHAGNANDDSIGILHLGDFTEEMPTQEQLDSLDWLIRELNYDFGRDLYIEGHYEANPGKTACPGDFDLNALRERHKC